MSILVYRNTGVSEFRWPLPHIFMSGGFPPRHAYKKVWPSIFIFVFSSLYMFNMGLSTFFYSSLLLLICFCCFECTPLHMQLLFLFQIYYTNALINWSCPKKMLGFIWLICEPTFYCLNLCILDSHIKDLSIRGLTHLNYMLPSYV